MALGDPGRRSSACLVSAAAPRGSLPGAAGGVSGLSVVSVCVCVCVCERECVSVETRSLCVCECECVSVGTRSLCV